MGTNIPCPIGMEIDNSEECEDARLWAYDLGINFYSSRSSSVYVGTWNHVPFQCSYQSGTVSNAGDLAFHFNTQDNDDVASFESGAYKMICRKGTNCDVGLLDITSHLLLTILQRLNRKMYYVIQSFFRQK